ncbi:MAG TPA: hypothetical protein VL461_08025 [Dictyobacter sp.]|nr:hypothetical protein [Dictyobacter sp.]
MADGKTYQDAFLVENNTHTPLPTGPILENSVSAVEQAPVFCTDRADGLVKLVRSDEQKSESKKNSQNLIDRSLYRLHDAAQRIASDPDAPDVHPPRISRLKPFHDISAEIRRYNTPLPKTAFSTEPGTQNIFARDDEQAQAEHVRSEELVMPADKKDPWMGQVDPLLSRRVPASIEHVFSTDEEKFQKVSIFRAGQFTVFKALKRIRVLPRSLFVVVIMCAVMALVLDVVLVTFLHKHASEASNLPPSLTLSQSSANYGEQVIIHLRNFTPFSQIALSRDIQERLYLVGSGSVVHASADGSKDLTIVIGSDWEPGSHLIEAEDISSRHTASAMLHIDAGPTRPAHLVVKTTQLDLGSRMQGANSLQSLTLFNNGGGNITWSASSNVPWLIVSPAQGIFSSHQDIQVAGDRTKMGQGEHTGTITFASDVGSPLHVQVHIEVQSLPVTSNAILAVTPPVLTYAAVDGMADPADQYLTISNMGKQSLSWSIVGDQSLAPTDTTSYLAEMKQPSDWLSTSQKSGVLQSGGVSSIRVHVHSYDLLPGNYTRSLLLTATDGHGILNSPQHISVSLTILPRCGATLSSGMMAFTAVTGQDSPANQMLSLTTTKGCSSIVSWSALSSASWLTMLPMHGQLNNATSSLVPVHVNSTSLKPGKYTGVLTITVGTCTQTVAVQLTVQPPPPPTTPIMKVSSLNLSFSVIQGQPDPAAQTVALANTGGGTLHWNADINSMAISWLSVVKSGDKMSSGQTATITIEVHAAHLTAGSYVGQVILSGTDDQNMPASGSPQMVSITFTVLPPCTLSQPSVSSLQFAMVQGSKDAVSPQQVTFTATGSCSWPVTWRIDGSSLPSWLKVTPSSDVFTSSGQLGALSVSLGADSTNLTSGVYTATVSIVAHDMDGRMEQGGSFSFTVALNVARACTLQAGSTNLSFLIGQGQTSSTQDMSLSDVGNNCAFPLTWSASIDTESSGWLVVSPLAGNENGKGSRVHISVDAAKLLPGNYSGAITFIATGSGGVQVQGAPQVFVTVTVTDYSISGTVHACSNSACSVPGSLADAKLKLIDSARNVVWSGVADENGNFTIGNIANGTYTILAEGGAGMNNYTGSQTITVSNTNVSGVVINAVATTTATPTPTAVSTKTP